MDETKRKSYYYLNQTDINLSRFDFREELWINLAKAAICALLAIAEAITNKYIGR